MSAAEKKKRESAPWQVMWVGEEIESSGTRVRPLVPEKMLSGASLLYGSLAACTKECERLAAIDIGRTYVAVKIGCRRTGEERKSVEVRKS